MREQISHMPLQGKSNSHKLNAFYKIINDIIKPGKLVVTHLKIYPDKTLHSQQIKIPFSK